MDNLLHLLHLRDFGALGDGTTDDTLPVQRAIDAAAGGPPLYLDAGRYRITSPLLVGSQTTIEGAGAASVLEFAWRDQLDGLPFCLGNLSRKDADEGDSEITLANFVLVGGTDGTPYGPADGRQVTHGICWRKVSEVDVLGVEVQNVSGFGICATGVMDARFLDNRICGTGRDGITSFALINDDDPAYHNFPLERLLIAENRIENVGDDGIAVHAGTAAAVNRKHPPAHIEIARNTIRARPGDHPQGQGRGICLSGVVDAFIEGNDIRRTVSTGILCQSWGPNPGEALRCRRITIRQNVVINAGRSQGLARVKCGIQLKGCDNVAVNQNGILDAADRGLDARDVTHVDISRNIISGSGGAHAILANSQPGGPTHHLTITDNLLIHDGGTPVLLFGIDHATDRNNVHALP